MTCAATATVSTAVCGSAACPPSPVITSVKKSEAAIAGPAHAASCPTGSGVHRWQPTTRSTPSSAPARTSSIAPPGGRSSAGWKRNRSSPLSSPARAASSCAAPSSIAVWPSCPQACMTPSRSEANSTPLSSWIGSASMSERSARVRPGRPVRRWATTLVSDGRVTSSPSKSSSVSATKRAVSRSS